MRVHGHGISAKSGGVVEVENVSGNLVSAAMMVNDGPVTRARDAAGDIIGARLRNELHRSPWSELVLQACASEHQRKRRKLHHVFRFLVSYLVGLVSKTLERDKPFCF